MKKSILAAAISAALLSACSPESAETEAAVSAATTEASVDDHTPPPLAEGEIAATGFVTAASIAIPDSADLSRGDVPRDSYGRPFTYEYLGEVLPAFSGTMATGDSFSSDSLADRWVVIDVWGLWCGDCMRDAKYVAALSVALEQDPDLEFLSIHTPPSAARADEAYKKYESVPAYFEEVGYSYPTLIDTDASIRDTLKVRWTPSYLLLAPDGTVQGFRTEFAAADGEPVRDFLRDIAEVRETWTPLN
ncbi:MAG: TlpA disulfide reductase family protein [Henriciella sp.]|nr:TlpA disulfide reductase family protein [Henriciella sp.]